MSEIDIYDELIYSEDDDDIESIYSEDYAGASLPVEQVLSETYDAVEKKLEDLDDSKDPNYLSGGMLNHALDLIDNTYEDIKNDFNTVWNEGRNLNPIGDSWEDTEDNWPQKRIDAAQRLLGKAAIVPLVGGAAVAGGAAAGTAAAIGAAAKRTAMTGSAALLPPALAYYNAQWDDSKEAKKRYEGITGEKYYTDEELAAASFPADEKDRIRSKQGGVIDKAKYGAEMMMKGFTDIISNPVKEWDKADSIPEKALLALDVPASFAVGSIPMTVGAYTDFTNSFLTDPFGTTMAMRGARLSAIKAKATLKGLKEGGIPLARAERKAAEIKARDERLESGRIISEFIDKGVDAAGENSFTGKVLRAVQTGQRGDARGVIGAPVSIAASLIPGFGYRGAGSRAEEIKVMKQADRTQAGKTQQLRAELDALARDNPLAFGAVKHVMTDNQKIAPEVFRVLSDLEEVQGNLLKEMKKTEKQLKRKKIKPEQLVEMQRHQRKLNEFQKRMNEARERVDPEALDKIRIDALSGKLLKKKGLVDKKGRKIRESDWADAARTAAAHVPRMAKVMYDGRPVTPLEFMLRPPKNFDAAKVGLQIMKDIPPEARLLLEQNSSSMVSVMQMMADQGHRLTKLVGPREAKLLKDQTFLLNTSSGYFPNSKIKDYFGSQSVSAGMGQLDVARGHLQNMKTKERKGELPSIKESISEIQKDRVAFEQFNQYANAMEHTIGALEYSRNLEKALIKGNRISDTKRDGYVRIGGKAPKGKKKAAVEADEVVLKSDYEFGNLQGKYVPKSVAQQIIRYDRFYGAIRKAMRAAQQGFKTTHTITNIPYFVNTAGGLAYTQTLFGGTPFSPFIGAMRFASKDKYYKALRDAGGIVDSDTLIGLESSGAKSWIIKQGLKLKNRSNKKGAEAKGWKDFPELVMDTYANWKTPIDPIYNKRGTGKAIGALTTAGMMGAASLGAGVIAGFGATPMALGMGTGFLLSKGRQLATLLDQGSRVESFARRMNELAVIESGRTGKSKSEVLSRLLKDPEAVRNATDFALYSNIDYSYVPFGVEHASSLVPQTPFVKFAHRAGEMMLDMPLNNPNAWASLTGAHKEYMRNLGSKEKWIYQNAPLNTGGLIVGTGDRDYINMAYMLPFSPQTINDMMTGLKSLGNLVGEIPGLDFLKSNYIAYPHSGAMLAKGVAEGQAISRDGYLGGFVRALDGVDRYGYPLPDRGALASAREFVNSYSPSSIYYLGQIREANQSPAGVDRYGYTADQIFFNSIGAKITPGSVAENKLRRARRAFRKQQNEFSRKLKRNRKDNRFDQEKLEKKEIKIIKKRRELERIFSSAVDGDTMSALNKILGFK